MPAKESKGTSSDFIVSRTFDAPKEKIFQLWLDPEHLKNWLPPGGMKMGYKKADVRVGGTSHFYMESPGGKMWGKISYKEIQKTDRLVYTQSFSDESGGIAAHPMSPTWPREMLTTVTFEAVGSKTKVTVTWTAINATEEEISTFENSKPSMNQGWSGSFDQLEKYLSGN